MTHEELSIGDWVNILNYHYDGSPYVGQVDGIFKKHGTYYLQFGSALSAEIDMCEPIHIIPEILEKNGFEPIYKDDKSAYRWKEYDDDDNYQSIVIDFRVKRACEVWNDKGKKSYKGEILCFHELQHIMKICGINKTIEP